jgi:chromosome segregation ATPase
MIPVPESLLQPTTKEINQGLLIEALGDKLKVVEGDLKSLQDVVRLKNEKVLKLEAENIRLKMQRTDAELATQVDGLRTEVGKKDRELVELRRRLETLQENEAIILRRAATAEEKVKVMQTTMGTMQRARDTAHEDVERHDRERLDAVRQMVDAQDRAKKLEARVAELENKKKTVSPIAKDQNVLRPKSK